LPAKCLLGWMGLGTSKFHQWRSRYGQVNEPNGKIPRDWWLEEWEKQAIVDYHDRHPREGYRQLTFMMLDEDVVAVSPTSVYRVLKNAGRLDRHRWAPSKKGTGFVQPEGPHKHWHLDIQRALEKYPGEHPRIITDNGPQCVSRDFQQFIRLMGLTHVRTSPYYPQSNGKLERWHGSIQRECIRPACPGSLEEALRLVASYVDGYNHVRLHSALGYITPADKLNGLETVIFAERDRKLEEARRRRQRARQPQREVG
jgi:putative transposase